jgi:hypothetical protein
MACSTRTKGKEVSRNETVCLAGLGHFQCTRTSTEHKASGDVNKALLAVAPAVVVGAGVILVTVVAVVV